jgi:hypothetical protein
MLMTSSAVSEDAVALLLRERQISGPELLEAVRSALSAAGCEPWAKMEAEIFTYGSGTLLIARPAPPLRERIPPGDVRLRRARDK